MHDIQVNSLAVGRGERLSEGAAEGFVDVEDFFDDLGGVAYDESAGGAAQGFELLVVKPPDVLISDIEMPGEDGYSLIRRVRGSLQQPNSRSKLLSRNRMRERRAELSNPFPCPCLRPARRKSVPAP